MKSAFTRASLAPARALLFYVKTKNVSEDCEENIKTNIATKRHL